MGGGATSHGRAVRGPVLQLNEARGLIDDVAGATSMNNESGSTLCAAKRGSREARPERGDGAPGALPVLGARGAVVVGRPVALAVASLRTLSSPDLALSSLMRSFSSCK